MSIKLVLAPSIEPVTLEEAKQHCRVWDDSDDEYLVGLIVAARRWCESYCSRSLITTRWREVFTDFPGYGAFRVLRAPLLSVSSIVYIDSAGASQTLDAATYVTLSDCEPGEVRLAYGKTWPSVRSEGVAAPVTLTYDAGYGTTADSVPASIRHAIKLMIGHWFENREPIVTGTIVAAVPDSAKSLLISEGWGDYL